MSDSTLDSIPESEQYKRKPRPMVEWDQIEDEKEATSTQKSK